MTSAVCEKDQDAGCGLDGTADRANKEEILQMVENGFIRSLQSGESKTNMGDKPRSFRAYLRRKRSSHTGFAPYHHDLTCPIQTDQSEPFTLRSNPNGYPTDLIAAELFQRSLPGSDLLFQCLARTVIEEDKGPVVAPQPFLEKGTTCPQTFNQLWTYNSIKYGNTLCWVLSNFQENILFAEACLGKPCLGCSPLDVPFSYDFNISYEKQCVPQFRPVSLWSFCPSLPENQRIVRDRIIIPVDCSCTTVSCKNNHHIYG